MNYLIDSMKKFERRAQVMLEKDIGLILSKTGIGFGSKVVEAGSGSGFLTAALANVVGEKGKIISYDNRKEHQIIAKKNLEKAGLSSRVEFKLKDVIELEEKELDAIILDLAEPWKVFKKAEENLKEKGFLVCFVPSYEQIKKIFEEIKKTNFKEIGCFELIERKIKLSEKSIRPETKGITHTGFLCFYRKNKKN